MSPAPRLVLVRHGHPVTRAVSDPGLDDIGRAQAERAAATLAPRGPMPILVSPLKRTRETALPLEAAWDVVAAVEPCVGELPSPPELGDATEDGGVLEARNRWLRDVLRRTWDEVDDWMRAWRDELLGGLQTRETDTVVVTHYVAINVAVGHTTGADRLISFAPDYCSVTELELIAGGLRVVRLGREGQTRVR